MGDLQSITKALIEFRDARDWKQFHNPKDLAIALSIESSELLELFLWKSAEEVELESIKEELADVLSFALILAHEKDIDIVESILKKIEKNKLKYPVEKARGSAKKYNEL